MQKSLVACTAAAGPREESCEVGTDGQALRLAWLQVCHGVLRSASACESSRGAALEIAAGTGAAQ